MLLQTNSYVVPDEKREHHARLMRRFRRVLARLGCRSFEVYEQLGTDWRPIRSGTRFVQIMRFTDRRHYQAVQDAETNDPEAQDLIRHFSEMLDMPAQQQRGLLAIGRYSCLVEAEPALPADVPPATLPEPPLEGLGMCENADQQAPTSSRDFTVADDPPSDDKPLL